MVTPELIVIPPAPVANDTLVAEVSDAPQANDPTFNNEDSGLICRFIDTHCHFDFPPFSGDEEASLQRAAQAGVGEIIVPGDRGGKFCRVQALAEKYQPLYAAWGCIRGCWKNVAGCVS